MRAKKSTALRKHKNLRTFFIFIIFCAFLVLLLTLVIVENNKSYLQIKKKSCGRFPTEKEILVENLVWQVLETSKGFIKILNAYLDQRQLKTVVRINVNGIGLNISTDEIYCQFWQNDHSEPYVVKATEFILMWIWGTKKTDGHPYMITCPFEREKKLPISVSITENPCDKAENNMKIINNQPVNGVKKRLVLVRSRLLKKVEI